MRILIVGAGHERGSLTAIRSFARAGWQVGVGTPGATGMIAASRYVQKRHDIPTPDADLDGFVSAVGSAVADDDYSLVFPSGDADMIALSGARDRLGSVVPYPPHARVMTAVDKMALTQAAQGVGMHVPRTWEPAVSDLDGEAYPLLVKARRHWAPGSRGSGRLEATSAHTAGEARAAIEKIRAAGGMPLLQDVVEGHLTAYCCVIDRDGRVVGDVSQHAKATWPVETGVSVRAVTVPTAEDHAERCSALLRSLGWFGIAELQFITPRDGSPRFIDLNGRFYGSLALAHAAGVDLPLLWAEVALGRQVELRGGRPGVRYQWLEGDLRRAMSQPGLKRVPDVLGSILTAASSVHSTFDRTDPGPLFYRLRTLVSGALSGSTICL